MSCADSTCYPLSPLISITPLFAPSTPTSTHPSFAVKSPHGGKNGHFFYLCSIQKIHNTCAISIISCDSQALQKRYTTIWLCPWFKDFRWMFIYFKQAVWHLAISTQVEYLLIRAKKRTLRTKQKTIPVGCCCSVCDTYFTAKCLRLLHLAPPCQLPTYWPQTNTCLHCGRLPFPLDLAPLASDV